MRLIKHVNVIYLYECLGLFICYEIIMSRVDTFNE